MDTERLKEQLDEYEQLKGDWASFEQNSSRFPFPRKNYKYVMQIVMKEGATPESIDRATAYFDTFWLWILRAEAYQLLAENVVAEEDKRRLAKAVFGFVNEELPNLHYDTEEIEQRLDHGIGFLNWAAVTSADSELIAQQRTFIYGRLPHILRDDPADSGAKKIFYEYYRDDFEAQLNKDAYCAARRVQNGNITSRESALGYMMCQSCNNGLAYLGDEWKQLSRRSPCVTGAAQVVE